MPAITASFALNRSPFTRAPKQICLLQVHNTTDRLRRFSWREQQESRFPLDMALGYSHIEQLLQIPTQMIDVGYLLLR
jgi:hypothetical protein